MNTDEGRDKHPDDDPVENPDTGPGRGGRSGHGSSLPDSDQATNGEKVLDPDAEAEASERAAAEVERREP